jgi:hypothetical protein
MLPTSDELLKTKAQQNYGIPQDAQIGPMNLQSKLNTINSQPTSLDANSVGVAGDIVSFGSKIGNVPINTLTEFGKVALPLHNALSAEGVDKQALDHFLAGGPMFSTKGLAEQIVAGTLKVSEDLSNKAKAYMNFINNQETLKSLKLPFESTMNIFKPEVPIEVPPDPSKVVPFKPKS